jgi:hypothetical protein
MSFIRFSLAGNTVLKRQLLKLRDIRALSLSKKLESDLAFFTPKGKTKVASTSWVRRKTRAGYTIQNNTSYIGVLEKGRHLTSRGMRGSTQAPNGILTPTLSKNARAIKNTRK